MLQSLSENRIFPINIITSCLLDLAANTSKSLWFLPFFSVYWFRELNFYHDTLPISFSWPSLSWAIFSWNYIPPAIILLRVALMSTLKKMKEGDTLLQGFNVFDLWLFFHSVGSWVLQHGPGRTLCLFIGLNDFLLVLDRINNLRLCSNFPHTPCMSRMFKGGRFLERPIKCLRSSLITKL